MSSVPYGPPTKECVECKRLSKLLCQISRIIEHVDNRCMAGDGPITPTLQEMKQSEISKIYKLAEGRNL